MFATLLCFIIAGCTNDIEPTVNDKAQTENTGKAEEPEQDKPKDQRAVIAENLEAPWAISKLGDVFYISERAGAIVTLKDGELIRKQVQLEKDLSNEAEAGLLGMVIPDEFHETKKAYAYYAYQDGEQTYQRIITIEEQDDQWAETSILVDRIPGGPFHHGGRMKIGPDNKLYVTTGDALMSGLAQETDNLAGKILRLNLDGSIPDDNPMPHSYLFSYGHRNPQGLAWNSEGQLFATEHGNQAHDEVNQILRGANYGWPVIEGDQTGANMETPLIHSGEETWAPSGMDYYKGNFYFASLRGEGVRKYNPVQQTEELMISDVGRVRDVLATDGGLYMITNNTDGRGNPAKEDDRLMFIPILE